jgi:hypothetical protein
MFIAVLGVEDVSVDMVVFFAESQSDVTLNCFVFKQKQPFRYTLGVVHQLSDLSIIPLIVCCLVSHNLELLWDIQTFQR